MIQIPKVTNSKFFLSPMVDMVIEEIKHELDFLQFIPAQYNFDEVAGYVEVIIDYEALSGVIIRIEVTKFLDEAIGYSVISRSEINGYSVINYYVEDLSVIVTRHINLLIEYQYLKTLSIYE